MKWVAYERPIHPSSMTRWRKRFGEAGAQQLLQETIQAGLQLKIVKNSQLKRVNVDSTVQEKEVRYPPDARLYDRARARLVKAARQRDIPIRQSYVRKAKELVIRQGRYTRARQMKRAAKCTRQLKTYLKPGNSGQRAKAPETRSKTSCPAGPFQADSATTAA